MSISYPGRCEMIWVPNIASETVALYAIAQRISTGMVWRRPDNDENGEPIDLLDEGSFLLFAEMDRTRAAGDGPGRNVGGGMWHIDIDPRLPDGDYRFLVYRRVGETPAPTDPRVAFARAARPFSGLPTPTPAPVVIQPAAPIVIRPTGGT